MRATSDIVNLKTIEIKENIKTEQKLFKIKTEIKI